MRPRIRATPAAIFRGATLVVFIAGLAVSAMADEAQQQKFKHTNRLIESNNPYLRLHAHNPVDWYPWGPEAIAKARKENKPIFLSVGYSTCYWCHVAERTLYSKPEIAALMNGWFVNVKVDREQRPDLDEIYMLARQLITGEGGWPNNVFLTPDLKPFYAGSYFPPATDQFGRPGFPQVLGTVHNAWASKRTEILAFADQVQARMQVVQEQIMAGGEPAAVAPTEWLAAVRSDYLQNFDAEHGGQRSKRTATKFPQTPVLELLLQDYRLNANGKVLRALSKTLDAMAYGGIYDHLAGGFHRYSTEPSWSVPHFEKMLYDNAQLLKLYAEAYKTTAKPLYRYIAEDIAAYLIGEMMSPEGGFYTAQDAQVGGVEGLTYRWREEDIVRILRKQAAERFFRVYELTPFPEVPGGTGADAGDIGGVLRVIVPIETTLRDAGFADPVAMLSALAPLRRQLLDARKQRPQPLRDEMLNVDLNGLAIEAFVAAGLVLDKPRYIELAKRAAERIWKRAYDPATGRLLHQLFRAQAQTEGFLADYALFGRGLMALYRATGDEMWRDRGAALADAVMKRFMAPDGRLAMTAGAAGPLAPVESAGDRTYPSGTSTAIHLLLRLGETRGGDRYANAAGRVLRYYSARLNRFPEMWATAVAAVNTSDVKKQTVIAPAAEASARPRLPGTADHVQVFAEAREGREGDEIVVTLKIDAGYHANANPASFDYLIPTTVKFEGISAVRVTYPDPVSFKPSFADQALNVYEGTPAVIAVFPRGTFQRTSTIRGTVKAQVCNDQICLPPSDLPISISLPARASTAK